MSDHDHDEPKSLSKKVLRDRLRQRMKEHTMTPRASSIEDVGDTAPSFDLSNLANDTAVISMDELLREYDLENVIATEELSGIGPQQLPSEAAPVEPEPVESTPVESAPVEPEPVESAPVESAPVESTPVESAPVESTPVESAPVEPEPVESAPVEPELDESAPDEPACPTDQQVDALTVDEMPKPVISATGLIHEDALLSDEDEEGLVLEGDEEDPPSVTAREPVVKSNNTQTSDPILVEFKASRGSVDTRIEQLDSGEEFETATSPELPINVGATLRPQEVTEGGLKGVLTVVSGPDQGKHFLLCDGESLIGRAPDCQVILTDAASSRRHCKIQSDGGIFTLLDLGSENGTEVNGTSEKQCVLEPDAQLTVGNTILHFGFLGDPEPSLVLAVPNRTVPSYETQQSNMRHWIALAVGVLVLLLVGLWFSGILTSSKRHSVSPVLVPPKVVPASSPATVVEEANKENANQVQEKPTEPSQKATVPVEKKVVATADKVVLADKKVAALPEKTANKPTVAPRPKKVAISPSDLNNVAKVAKTPVVKKRTQNKGKDSALPQVRSGKERLAHRAGYALYDSGDIDGAIAFFDRAANDSKLKSSEQRKARAISKRVKSFRVNYNAGLQASPGQSLTYLKRAKAVDRKLTGAYQARIRTRIADAHAALAAKAFASGQNAKAAKHAKSALALDAGSVKATSILKQLDGRINMMLAEAQVAKRGGRNEDAKRILQNILKILRRNDPRRGRAKMMLMGL